MDIENEPEQLRTQSDSDSVREDSANKIDRAQAETAGTNHNTSSHTKKMKLENGNVQQRERKRSRFRSHKKIQTMIRVPHTPTSPHPTLPTRQFSIETTYTRR